MPDGLPMSSACPYIGVKNSSSFRAQRSDESHDKSSAVQTWSSAIIHACCGKSSATGGVIAYSLGNFIGDMTWDPVTRGSELLEVRTNEPGSARHDFFRQWSPMTFFRASPAVKSGGRKLSNKWSFFERAGKKAEQLGYDVLARRERRRHRLLAVQFFVTNIGRYRLARIGGILSHAVSVRLPGRERGLRRMEAGAALGRSGARSAGATSIAETILLNATVSPAANHQ